MSNSYLNIPGSGIGSSGSAGATFWKNPVADIAALPASGNSPGDTRRVLDTYNAYVWNGSAWIISPGGGSGTPGGSNQSIQVNDGGSFGGDTNLIYDGSTVSILSTGAPVGFGLASLVLSNTSSEAGIDIKNVGAGGQEYSIVSTNNASGIGGGAFAILDCTNTATRLYINNSGLVGIGTNNPGHQLDVVGSINASTYVQTPIITTNTGDLILESDSGSIDFSNEQLFHAGSLAFTGTTPSTGIIRIPNADSINWRNFANTGDLGFRLNNSDHFVLDSTIEINSGHLFQAENKSIADSSGFITYNVSQNGATFNTPVTNTAIIFNTLTNVIHADDDFTSLFGFGCIGLAPSVSVEVANTKTVDLITSVASSIQVGATSAGGTLTTGINYAAFGIFNNGGTLTVDTLIGYEISGNFGSGATNSWGIKDDSSSENSLNRLAINTSSQKVSAGTTGLEINDKDLVLTGTSNVRISGNLGVGNSAAATTPGTVVKKIEIFDASGTSLGFIAVYDSIA